jgi:N-acetylmuramoyl-L-alanine amidase
MLFSHRKGGCFVKLKRMILPLLMFFIVSGFGNITRVHGEETNTVLVVEKPVFSSLVGGDVEVCGYAFSQSPIAKVEVFVDNVLKGQATCGMLRQDVQAVYPGYANSLNSGFSFKFNSRGLDDGTHQFKVVVTDSNFNSVSSFVDVQVKNQRTPIMGQTVATKEQMIKYFQKNSIAKDYSYINDFVTFLLEEAAIEGIRADLAFAQMMKETNFLKFTGAVKDGQNNFAGIGATGGTVVGATFPDVRTGIRAVIQHLKAYATTEPLNQTCVDPRYQYVAKGSSPYAEWLGKYENPITGIGWATGLNYGYDIVYRIGVINEIQVVKTPAVITSFTMPGEVFVNKTFLGTAAASSANNVLYRFSIVDKSNWQTTVLREYNEKNNFSWKPSKAGSYAVIVQAKDQFSTNAEDQIIVKDFEVKETTGPKTIVIDAGHGGSDPGAIANGYNEKDLNIRLTQKVVERLRALGHNVLLTRIPESDVYKSLEERAKYANDINADLFISIHHDAASNVTAGGTSVYYSSYRPGIDNSDVYVSYNGGSYKYIREGNGGYYINYFGTEKFVSVDDGAACDSTPSDEVLYSAALASKISEAISSLGLLNRGAKDKNFYVTRKTNMPSLLIETGFMTNPTEIQKLADDSFQSAAADKITEVVNSFLIEKLGATQPIPVPTPQPNPNPTPVPTPTPVPIIKKGWVKESDGTIKYHDMSTGVMKTGWQVIDGKAYYFNKSGVMLTGWQAINGRAYYLGPNGVMRTGWETINGKVFNFDSSGMMRTGWYTENGKKYYLGTGGVMQTGWYTENGKKYYFNTSGVMQTGWVLISKKYYYFNVDGRMAVNTKVGKYRVGKDGARL